MRRLNKDIMRENSGAAKKKGLRGKALDRTVAFDNMVDQYDNRAQVKVDKVNGSKRLTNAPYTLHLLGLQEANSYQCQP